MGTPALRRILAGTDGSPRAEEAARQAVLLAGALDASLEFLFVVDTAHPHVSDIEAEGEAALARVARLAAAAGVQAPTRLAAGPPAKTLVEEAAEHGIDLLCVGPDAGILGGAIRVGQVAAHVVREAPCSVLMGREAGPDFPTRVACGVDGSPGSVDTATLAAQLAAATGAELRLLHVVPVFRGDNAEWTLDPEEPSPQELEPSVHAAVALGVVPVREMAMGRPESAIVATASRDGTDLVVVGHRGVSGVRRVFLGSVSEHVTTHAPCSVLVARPRRAAE
ncbi:MAG TPA: universal stress protein [Actinomycetota bacterium]|nr:universal stress protein [Actinomycetota bacterium]